MPLFLSPVYAEAPDEPTASPPTVSFSTAGSAKIGGGLTVAGAATMSGGLTLLGSGGLTVGLGGLTELQNTIVQGTLRTYGAMYPPIVASQAQLAAFNPVSGGALVALDDNVKGCALYLYDDLDIITPTAWPWAVRSSASGYNGCWKIANYAAVGKTVRVRQHLTTGTTIPMPSGGFGVPPVSGYLAGLTDTFIVGTTVLEDDRVIPKADSHYEVSAELSWSASPWDLTGVAVGRYIRGALIASIDNDGAGNAGGPYFDTPGSTTVPSASNTYLETLYVAQSTNAPSRAVAGVRGKSRLPVGPSANDMITLYLCLQTNETVPPYLLGVENDGSLYFTVTITAY